MNKLIDNLIYLKIAWGQAWESLGVFVNICQIVLPLSTFLIVSGFSMWRLAGCLVVVGVFCIFYFGHLVLSKGILEREMTLRNKYNPQIKQILKNTDK